VAFTGPNLLLIAVFAYWPVIQDFYLSLTRWDFIAPAPTFVGLANYADMFTDRAFLDVLVTTVVFAAGVVTGGIVLGMLVAVLLNQRLRGRGVVRTLVFAPYVLPGAAVATVWLMMFDPNYGLSRVVFDAIGRQSPDWMTDSAWALPGLVVVYLWRNIGFCAIVYLAGMQSLPVEPYEAAELDGASKARQFFSLTVPLLSPSTFFLLLMQVIGTFQSFDIIAVMTGGGPAGATTTLSWFIYEQGFMAFDIGRSAAGSVVMFLLLLALTALQSRLVGKKVHYQ
jgi:sn-glycerol 3-phosphate transport system permease protein